MEFSGFTRSTRYTPVPAPLLGPLLEAIDDPAELKCTFRMVWLLHQKRGHPRYLTAGEVMGDRVLRLGLKSPQAPAEDAIRRGIRKARERGTLLALTVERDGTSDELYLLNDEAGRRALAMIAEDKGGAGAIAPRECPDPASYGPRPSIFTLYEENIGILSPLLADQLKEAEEVYPEPWIEEAFRIAVTRNVRNWRYIEATLRRWATEGKDDGESGRYSQTDLSKEGLLEYLRRRGRLPGPGAG